VFSFFDSATGFRQNVVGSNVQIIKDVTISGGDIFVNVMFDNSHEKCRVIEA